MSCPQRQKSWLRTRNRRTDPEAPWSAIGPSGLTGKRLGDLLSDFDIRSDTIRFPVGQAKGYHRPDFIDAWARYCPPPPGALPVPPATMPPMAVPHDRHA